MLRQSGQTRREFLRAAGAVALAPAIVSRAGLPRQDSKPATLAAPIGVCTSLNNADMLRQAGVDYIEEAVGRFLIPRLKPGAIQHVSRKRYVKVVK